MSKHQCDVAEMECAEPTDEDAGKVCGCLCYSCGVNRIDSAAFGSAEAVGVVIPSAPESSDLLPINRILLGSTDVLSRMLAVTEVQAEHWALYRLVSAERQRQIDVKRYTPEHDDEHGASRLAQYAVAELMSSQPPERSIIRAMALLHAAWDSLKRQPDQQTRSQSTL